MFEEMLNAIVVYAFRCLTGFVRPFMKWYQLVELRDVQVVPSSKLLLLAMASILKKAWQKCFQLNSSCKAPI